MCNHGMIDSDVKGDLRADRKTRKSRKFLKGEAGKVFAQISFTFLSFNIEELRLRADDRTKRNLMLMRGLRSTQLACGTNSEYLYATESWEHGT